MTNIRSSILSAILLFLALSGTGCVGWNLWSPIQSKPYSYLKGGQFGRDQIANRTLVGYTKNMILKGRDASDVLTLLGQPQQIKIIKRNVSEDWYFIYYKTYVAYNPANKIPYPGKGSQGEFVVRLEDNKVTDVVKLS